MIEVREGVPEDLGTSIAAVVAGQKTLGANERITITMTSGVFTGTLDSLGPAWRITDGVIAARWHEPDIFAALSSYGGNGGDPLCTDFPIGYATAKATICNGLDILEDGSGPKSLPCDSLSMGIGFKAVRRLFEVERARRGRPELPYAGSGLGPAIRTRPG